MTDDDSCELSRSCFLIDFPFRMAGALFISSVVVVVITEVITSDWTIGGVEEAIAIDGFDIGTICCGAGESFPNSGRNFRFSSSRFSRSVLIIFSSSSNGF